MIKIRRSRDRRVFNMGIPIPGTVFILKRGPGRDFQRFEGDFRCFCEVIIVEEIKSISEDRSEFTLVSLYTTKITHYRS